MKICLLAEPTQNPVLTSALDQLAQRHTVTTRDVQHPSEWGFPEAPHGRSDVDMYLLKSRSAAARAFARQAQRAGALVVNTPEATDAALDRLASARLLEAAGVPTPRTWSFRTLRGLAAAGSLPWPLVVKSRVSRRGDLVRLVSDPTELAELLPQWGAEPVIAQELVPNDGFDLKFWVIGGHVSVARRPCALEVRRKDQDVEIDPATLPAEITRAAVRAGAALGLELFGADVVLDGGRPVVIDVNAFPGFRGADGAATHLADFLERHAAERMVTA